MEDAVKFSTHVWSSIVLEDIIDGQDLAYINYHLFIPMKESLRGKHYSNDEEV